MRVEACIWTLAFLIGLPAAWLLGFAWGKGSPIKASSVSATAPMPGERREATESPPAAPSPPPVEHLEANLVLQVANSFPDGGGFNWDSGTGTPEEIRFKGARILSRARRGTYCCGFTFAVVMRVATQAGLLRDRSVSQVRKFQQHWYAATPDAREKQQIHAIEWLGIGREVPFMEARPGDFLRLWHGHSGHSVILVRWVVQDGRKIGVEYRGTQGSTDGIGNRIEYVCSPDRPDGEIILERSYAGRLSLPAPR